MLRRSEGPSRSTWAHKHGPILRDARKRRAPQDEAYFRASHLFLRLAGILDRLKGLEFDVVELAVDLLDLADVDVLHDVAGFRIDRDRPSRTFPLHPLHGLDQAIAVGLAAG